VIFGRFKASRMNKCKKQRTGHAHIEVNDITSYCFSGINCTTSKRGEKKKKSNMQ